MSLAAVIFDLDGVLVDSERIWNEARRDVALANGGTWAEEAQRAMMGMSSLEWSRYMHDALGVEPAAPEISEAVVARVERLYRSDLPLIDGAREVVLRLAEVWPLGLASSANRSVIDLVLDLADLSEAFAATLSSEEVPHGKPAPDVYLEAARRLAAPAPSCAAIEDSASGLRSASAAGMTVVAIPNHDFPPEEDSLGLADRVLDSIRELTPGVVRRVAEDRLNS